MPSVKGTLVQNLAGELKALLEQGRLDREGLARDLEPGDLALIDRDIALSAWYPVAAYGRLLEVFARGAGGDRRATLIASGRRSAQRVIELGIYSQLDTRTEESWENRVGRILVTLAGSLFDFGRWEWQGLQSDGSFSISVQDAQAMPDPLVLRTGGFIEHLAARAAAAPVHLDLQRSPDLGSVHYRARRIR